jgi:maleylacetate reductase
MNFSGSSMEAFQYTALPARVVFGLGTIAKVADELVSLGRKRAFVLSDPHHATAAAARLMRLLDDFGVQLSTDAVMHTPVEVTERVIDAGSEATPVLGETREGQKSTIRSMKVLPEVMELLSRFARSECRNPIWTRPPMRR